MRREHCLFVDFNGCSVFPCGEECLDGIAGKGGVIASPRTKDGDVSSTPAEGSRSTPQEVGLVGAAVALDGVGGGRALEVGEGYILAQREVRVHNEPLAKGETIVADDEVMHYPKVLHLNVARIVVVARWPEQLAVDAAGEEWFACIFLGGETPVEPFAVLVIVAQRVVQFIAPIML